MGKVSSTFRKINLREMSFCVIAILAMCVSAVSACACTHHQQKAADEEPSCHSSHVETAQAETDRTQSDSLETNCNCFINEPVPAIVSKTESKKVAVEEAERIGDVLVASVRLVILELKQESGVFDRADLNYSSHLLVSGPSRAPPRP